MMMSQSNQAQVQIRVDSVAWNLAEAEVTLKIRNIGGVSATIESIGIRKDLEGMPFYIDKTSYATGTVTSGDTRIFTWSETCSSAQRDFLAKRTSYVIRVMCSTGFYYELRSVSQ